MISKLLTRTVTIVPKQTSAGTQYYEMSAEDEAYIYNWLTQFLCDIGFESTFDEEWKREFFRRRADSFPKSRKGPNSIASMIGGILGDKCRNPARDLSEPQLDPIELIFDMIGQYYEGVATVRFSKKLFEFGEKA